jgi:hypothetical protein
MGRFRAKRKLPLPQDVSGTPVPVPRHQRSSVTNGKRLFVELRDKHSPWSRRLRDLLALMVSDRGGADNCSENEKSLIRRAAQLTLQLELMEQKWAKNGGEASEKSLIVYQRTASALRRILETLGLKRCARDITPSLGSMLREEQEDQKTINWEAAE